jgi:hypothetical protein
MEEQARKGTPRQWSPRRYPELTREMVDRARIKALLSETDTITKHLKDLRMYKGMYYFCIARFVRLPLPADESFSRHGEPRTTSMPQRKVMIELTSNSRLCWKPGTARSMSRSRRTASCSNRASGMISKKADEFIHKAIEKTLKDCKLGDIRSGDGKLGRRAPTGEKKYVQRTRSSTCAEGVAHREARCSL